MTCADLDEFVAPYLPTHPLAKRRATWDPAADGGKGVTLAVDGKRPRAVAGRTSTTNSSHGTSAAWISSGCATKVWKTART